MRSLYQLFAALLLSLRRRWSRFRARRLLAEGLPKARALLESGQLRAEIRPAFRELPPPPAIEVPLAALPKPPTRLDRLRLRAFLLDDEARPSMLAEPLPLLDGRRFQPARVPRQRPEPRPIESGAARPDKLGLDEQGRPPAAREQPELSAERPPPPRPGRLLRPRLPLPRAPIRWQLDWRAFRADRRDGALANEGLIEPRPDPALRWLLATFRAEIVEARWLERRFRWPPPTDVEWFLHWLHERDERRSPGGKEPLPRHRPKEIDWLLWQYNKEQMLIRRDVPKDEDPPKEPRNWVVHVENPGIGGKPAVDVSGLVKKDDWIVVSLQALREFAGSPLPGQTFAEPMRQRRELLRALEDR